MKTRKNLIISVIFFCRTVNNVFAQDPQVASNYIVIGAFTKISHAVQLTSMANQDNFHAQYAINTQRKLYYVFILDTQDLDKALAFLIKIQTETKYRDAWLYKGKLGEETEPILVENDRSPVIEEKKVEPVIIEPAIIELVKKDATIALPIITVDSLVISKPEVSVEKKPDGKPFYFKLVSSESGKEVIGEVQIVESKATHYQAFKGNELIYLAAPKNSDGVYIVNILAGGYKPAKLSFNYKDPSTVSSGAGEKQEIIIAFELTLAKKGDYIDFTNVRFFRNSAILEPISKIELDGLVGLMAEHQNYKIKIHGHCNGDDARDIITLGNSTNFFALDSKNRKEAASAKKLTELRAEAVKNYFVSQGIPQDRIATKGEGGMMMIYTITSTLANYNDRVEIEVLKGK